MTNNSSERLDRLEAILETTIQGLASNSRDLAATRKIVESNGKAIQAMLDQRASEQLKHEQQLEEQRKINLEQQKINQKLTNYIEGLANMFARFDEERPTILRKLTTIENKLDSLQTIETKLDRIIEQ